MGGGRRRRREGQTVRKRDLEMVSWHSWSLPSTLTYSHPNVSHTLTCSHPHLFTSSHFTLTFTHTHPLTPSHFTVIYPNVFHHSPILSPPHTLTLHSNIHTHPLTPSHFTLLHPNVFHHYPHSHPLTPSHLTHMCTTHTSLCLSHPPHLLTSSHTHTCSLHTVVQKPPKMTLVQSRSKRRGTWHQSNQRTRRQRR